MGCISIENVTLETYNLLKVTIQYSVVLHIATRSRDRRVKANGFHCLDSARVNALWVEHQHSFQCANLAQYVPFRQTETYSENRSDKECPERFEAKRAEKEVFPKKRDMKTVLPPIHFHVVSQLEYGLSLSVVSKDPAPWERDLDHSCCFLSQLNGSLKHGTSA